MAVYKPTYCYPYLSTVDIRVTPTNDDTSGNDKPAQFLSCKIDTSNSAITGYSVHLMDEYNNRIFPLEEDHISPISELQISGMYEEYGMNSGLNGTLLKIPFFQNINQKLLNSYNAIYYQPRYKAEHIIMDQYVAEFFYSAAEISQMSEAMDSSNWSIDTFEGSPCLRYDNWGTGSKNLLEMDGEVLVKGEQVLVAIGTVDHRVNTTMRGIWEVSEDDNSELILTPVVTWAAISGQTVITKGNTLHNCVLQLEAGQTARDDYFIPVGPSELWHDCSGAVVSGLQVDGRALKWEVTLYQGNGVVATASGGVQYITYNSLEEQFLDIKLNSGTILGSTTKRIQIANADPAENNGIGTFYVPYNASGDLVLQGRYVALGYVENTVDLLNDSRIYVKSYDATYGHVYLPDDTLQSNTLGMANACQFYKHSNDPEAILDTDIVDWGVKYSMPLYIEEGYDLNANFIAIDDINYPNLQDVNLFQDNNLILLTNQDNSYQNGVYQYHYVSDGQEGSDHNIYHRILVRAPSYTTWASYLGKIIYCERGNELQGKNIESLAPAGSYTLWNPKSSTSGTSSLLFAEERPILLFNQLLTSNRTFKLYDKVNNRPSSVTFSWANNEIDKQNIVIGDLILFKDGQPATVTDINDTSTPYTITLEPVDDQINADEYVYITAGQDYGQRVFKWTINGMGDSANWDLYTARILRNSPNLTYISPFSGLEPGMMLKMANSKYLTLAGRNSDIIVPKYMEIGQTANVTVTSWLKVNTYNNVLHFITHDPIDCSSDGLDINLHIPRPDQTYGLASYGGTDDIPWKYEIRSYFSRSNENIFYAFERPYIRLKKDGIDYTGLILETEYDFDVREALLSAIYQDFYVKANESSVTSDDQFVFTYYLDQDLIVKHSLELSAEYEQFNQISWESFRWVLFDEEGNVLQDTGNKYEGPIRVIFDGLSTLLGSDRTYYICLLITDDMYNTTCSVIKFISGEDSEAVGPENVSFFKATLDQPTHSVLLDFDIEDESLDELGIISYSYYRREYDVYNKPCIKIPGYYYNDNFYQDVWHEHLITPIAGRVYVDKTNGNDYGYVYQNGEFNLTPLYKEFIGPWEPVLLNTREKLFRDYNVTAGRSYQYIVYLNQDLSDEDAPAAAQQQMFANYTGTIFVADPDQIHYPGQGKMGHGDSHNITNNGEPVKTCWNEWALIELDIELEKTDNPAVKHKYKTNLDQLWLFKFSLETGTQTQNISRSEIQTLGTYPRIGFGQMNYMSGEVSALLGSEIIPYSKSRYIERLGASRVVPLSTNEKAEMLKQWHKLVRSKKPKLLTDMKGQAWIVQIMSSSNKPQNFYYNQPDTISFQWKQVADLKDTIVYGNGEVQEFEKEEGSMEWHSVFTN